MLSFGTDGFGSDVFLDGSGPDDERTTLPLPPPLAVPTATALPPPPAEAVDVVLTFGSGLVLPPAPMALLCHAGQS